MKFDHRAIGMSLRTNISLEEFKPSILNYGAIHFVALDF
jgi:hypothetical protein